MGMPVSWAATDVGGSAVPERREAGGAPLWLVITPGGSWPSAVTQLEMPIVWSGCCVKVDIVLFPMAMAPDPTQSRNNAQARKQAQTRNDGHDQEIAEAVVHFYEICAWLLDLLDCICRAC